MIPLGMFGTFGIQELLLILLIVVFLFGARRIPEVARGLGQGIRGFRTALKGEGEDAAGAEDEAAQAPKKTTQH